MLPFSDELIASMGTIGVACGFLECLCTWLLGFKSTCFIIAIGAPASISFFSLTAYCNKLFHSWPSVICLVQLFVCKYCRRTSSSAK